MLYRSHRLAAPVAPDLDSIILCAYLVQVIPSKHQAPDSCGSGWIHGFRKIRETSLQQISGSILPCKRIIKFWFACLGLSASANYIAPTIIILMTMIIIISYRMCMYYIRVELTHFFLGFSPGGHAPAAKKPNKSTEYRSEREKQRSTRCSSQSIF